MISKILGTSWRTTLMGIAGGLFAAFVDYLNAGNQLSWKSTAFVICGYLTGYFQRDNKVTSEQVKNIAG